MRFRDFFSRCLLQTEHKIKVLHHSPNHLSSIAIPPRCSSLCGTHVPLPQLDAIKMPSNKFLFASFLLITFVSSVLLASCPHSSDPSLTRPKREDEVSGSGDRLNNEEEELQKARLEFIKLQILQRLGMSKAPKIKRKQVDIAACEYSH